MNPNSFALCNTCQNRIPLQRLPIPPHLHMSLLGHIVERCGGSYTQPELHRGVKGKYQLPETSCFCGPQLIYSWSTGRDASPEMLPAMVQTAGLEPAHTSRRGALPTELRLHTPGIRRGQEERKDGKNEDADITPHPHSRTSVRQHSSIWRNLKYLFSVQFPLSLVPAELVEADVVIRGDQFQLR